MPTDVDRIAEVIAAHILVRRFQSTNYYCICGWDGNGSSTAHVAEQLAQAGIGHVPTALRQAADALESASVARRDKELSAGSPVEDMREDRLIRLGIAEATVTIRTIAKTVEAKP